MKVHGATKPVDPFAPTTTRATHSRRHSHGAIGRAHRGRRTDLAGGGHNLLGRLDVAVLAHVHEGRPGGSHDAAGPRAGQRGGGVDPTGPVRLHKEHVPDKKGGERGGRWVDEPSGWVSEWMGDREWVRWQRRSVVNTHTVPTATAFIVTRHTPNDKDRHY